MYIEYCILMDLAQMGPLVHPGLECGLESVWSSIKRVRGEADEIEIPLHEVQDHLLPYHLQEREHKYLVIKIRVLGQLLRINLGESSVYDTISDSVQTNQAHCFAASLNLLFLRGDVVLPLGLDDALPQVLQSVPLWRRTANVDHVVDLLLPLCRRRLRR